MFVNELAQIKESEDKADQLKAKAKTDSRKILEDANNKADEIVTQAENLAKADFDSLIKMGQELSNTQYDEYIEQTKIQCKQMIDNAKSKQESVVDMIAERIVSSSVNS